jgi:hypothetical protein
MRWKIPIFERSLPKGILSYWSGDGPMSVEMRPSAGASNKPALPTGLLIVTILVIVQALARAGFLVTAAVVNARFLGNPTFLVLSVIIPAILLILTVVMVVLIFARVPAAKPYGITVCILNLLFQLFAIARFVSSYHSNPNITINPQFVVISIAYLTIFTLALIFLAKWSNVSAAQFSAPAGIPGTSYKGMAKTSLVCAICGPLFLVVLGPVALGLGIAARTKMRRSNNFDGQGMALAGVIIGSIETALAVLLLLLAIAMRF